MSIATVASAIETKVLANTTATTAVAVPVSQNFSVASGATVMRQLPIAAGIFRDSNTNYLVGSFDVVILHYLTNDADEDVYLTGDALTDQGVLMDPEFFRSVAGVNEVIDGPELERPVRIGNIIEYAVTVQLAVNP